MWVQSCGRTMRSSEPPGRPQSSRRSRGSAQIDTGEQATEGISMAIQERVTEYAISQFNNDVVDYNHVVRLTTETGHQAFIAFPEQPPAQWLTVSGPSSTAYLEKGEFDRIHHLLQTECPVFLTSINLLGIRAFNLSTSRGVARRGNRRRRRPRPVHGRASTAASQISRRPTASTPHHHEPLHGNRTDPLSSVGPADGHEVAVVGSVIGWEDVTVPRRATSPVLIGRDGERASLAASFRAACAGGPVTVLIAGEAGVGKTRLVTEFAHDVGATTTVLCGACIDERVRAPARRCTLRRAPSSSARRRARIGDEPCLSDTGLTRNQHRHGSAGTSSVGRRRRGLLVRRPGRSRPDWSPVSAR